MNGKINIRGVYFDNVSFDEALEKAAELVSCDGVSVMFTPNSEIVQSCVENKELFDVINSADLVIPDGIGVVYASKILKTPLKQKVPGCEVAEKLLEYAAKSGDSVFFFGGAKKTQDSEAVCDIAAARMIDKYRDLKIAGTRDGFFKEEDVPGIIEQINKSGAKILFVCLGAPKQEKWIAAHKSELPNAVYMGIGGSLDVFAGTVKRAPEFYTKHGIEWLYRLCKQPSRFVRMLELPRFGFKVLIKGRKFPQDK